MGKREEKRERDNTFEFLVLYENAFQSPPVPEN
jgi:hypothetical protein